MREFYLKGKSKGIAFRGIVLSNDLDYPPFDYYRLSHIELVYKMFS